jgi:prefoldin subunit 5
VNQAAEIDELRTQVVRLESENEELRRQLARLRAAAPPEEKHEERTCQDSRS